MKLYLLLQAKTGFSLAFCRGQGSAGGRSAPLKGGAAPGGHTRGFGQRCRHRASTDNADNAPICMNSVFPLHQQHSLALGLKAVGSFRGGGWSFHGFPYWFSGQCAGKRPGRAETSTRRSSRSSPRGASVHRPAPGAAAAQLHTRAGPRRPQGPFPPSRPFPAPSPSGAFSAPGQRPGALRAGAGGGVRCAAGGPSAGGTALREPLLAAAPGAVFPHAPLPAALERIIQLPCAQIYCLNWYLGLMLFQYFFVIRNQFIKLFTHTV